MAGIAWHPSALRELDDIEQVISQDSPQRAAAFIRRIFATVERLELFPESSRVVPDFDRHDVRELIVGNYRAIYSVTPDEVTVLAVRHGARLLGDIPGL